MARIARRNLIVPGVPHHIVVRSSNRRRLFSYPFDYYQLLRYLDSALRRHGMPLHQITLLPDQVILLTSPPSQTALSDAMKVCLQRYARERNRRKDGRGTLFEGRFRSWACAGVDDLVARTLHSDASAFVAGQVEAPDDHRWSTCAIHHGAPERSNIPIEMWTPSPWYAALGAQRAARYREMMRIFLAGRMPEWRARLFELEAEGRR